MRGHVRKTRKSGNRAARRPPQRRATFFAKALTYVHAKKTFKESTDGVSPHARSTHARKRVESSESQPQEAKARAVTSRLDVLL